MSRTDAWVPMMCAQPFFDQTHARAVWRAVCLGFELIPCVWALGGYALVGCAFGGCVFVMAHRSPYTPASLGLQSGEEVLRGGIKQRALEVLRQGAYIGIFELLVFAGMRRVRVEVLVGSAVTDLEDIFGAMQAIKGITADIPNLRVRPATRDWK